MTALDTVHHKATLLQDLERNPYMAQFVESYINSLMGRLDRAEAAPTTAYPDDVPPALRKEGAFLPALTQWVRTSESFYISPDMMDLVFAAATTLEDSDDTVFEAWTPPTPVGWLWLPVPLTVLDVRSQVLRFSGCVWAVFGGYITVVWFSDKYDPVDSVNQTIRASGQDNRTWPRFTISDIMRIPLSRPIGKSWRLTTPDGGGVPPSVPITAADVGDKVVYVIPRGYGPEDWTPVEAPNLNALFLFAFWTIMGQKIATRHEERLPKKLRRLVLRMNLPDVPISVIEFRRAQVKHDGGSTVEWNHRFLRRGTFRWQWFGSAKDGTRYQKKIWIHPSIVNAHRTDLPLLVREHVNALLH